MCSPGCRVQVLMEGRVEQWSRSLGMSTWVKLHMVLYAGSKEIRCQSTVPNVQENSGIIYTYIESLRYVGGGRRITQRRNTSDVRSLEWFTRMEHDDA